MKITNVSQPIVFKNLYYTNRLKNTLSDETTPFNVFKNMNEVRNIITNSNSHKKKYVDIILDYNNYDEFTATISSKKQGTPYHPDANYLFTNKKQDIKDFPQWVNEWNYDYSPRGIEKFEKLKRLALENIIKHRQAKENQDFII